MHQLPPAFPSPAAVPHVKVCGLTRAEDALLALELGASFLGLIFASESPRRVSLREAAKLLELVRMMRPDEPALRPVGVFVAEPVSEINETVRLLGLSAVQLHGLRDDYEMAQIEAPILRAIRVRGSQSAVEIEDALARGAVLLDTFVEGQHGGTGKVFDHELALPHLDRGPVFIAGGLNPENIGSILGRFRQLNSLPYAFDVSSGLEEKPGVKDPEKLRAFFREFQQSLA